jgi:hypothetical protein
MNISKCEEVIYAVSLGEFNHVQISEVPMPKYKPKAQKWSAIILDNYPIPAGERAVMNSKNPGNLTFLRTNRCLLSRWR